MAGLRRAVLALASAGLLAAPPAGAVTFSPAPSAPIPLGPFYDEIAVADVDVDGNPDVLATTRAGGPGEVAVLLGNGDGGFQEKEPRIDAPVTGRVAFAHFDGDAHVDFVAPGGFSGVTVMLGDGQGGFSPAPSPPPDTAGGGTMGPATGDFNLDGHADFVIVHPNPKHVAGDLGDSVTVMLGDGDGEFAVAPGSPFPAGHRPWQAAVADFNGDAKPDVITSTQGDRHAGSSFNVMLGDGAGGLGAPIGVVVEAGGLGLVRLALGDFNDDGTIDVASHRDDDIVAYLGDGTGHFTEAPQSPYEPFPPMQFTSTSAFASGDIDAEGDVDLVTGHPRDFVSALLGDGAGDFVRASAAPFAIAGPERLALADVDDDGLLDVVTLSFECPCDDPMSGDLAVLLNGPPETSIAEGPSGTVESPDATFSFVSPDIPSTFECRLDGGDWSACTSSKSYSNLTAGSHTFEVRATNDVGKTDPTPEARTWTVAAPSTSITGGPSGTTRRTSATFTFDSSPSGTGFQCSLDGGGFEACPSPKTYSGLGGGTHTLSVRAVDDGGNVDPAPPSRSWTVDLTTPPDGALSAAPNPVLTGDTVTFDASASRDPLDGTIVEHHWDLDGNGSFELDTDGSPTATRVYPERQLLTARVRVTNEVGTSDVATIELDVRRAPPAGELGVSINDGARYTNNLQVTVSAVWPRLATDLRISNDGGFRAAQSFPVAPEVPWTLDPEASERLPQTIYVRFSGGSSGPETYQDDIILDRSRPAVRGARVTDVSPPSFKLRLWAADRVSGVRYAQTAVSTRDPEPVTRYKSTLRVRGSKRPRWVRVRDRAGNWSRWHRTAVLPRG